MMDLVCILGDSNGAIASILISRYVNFFGIDNFYNQLESVLNETSTVISDLVDITNNYFPERHRALNDDNSARDRRTLKIVTLRKKPKKSWQEKSVFLQNASLEGTARQHKLSQVKIEQVVDKMKFVVDIVMSLSSWKGEREDKSVLT